MNTPSLRFKDFASSYSKIKVGDLIGSLDSGVSVNSEDVAISSDSEFGILKTSCISGGVFYKNENKKILSNEIKRARLNPIQDSILVSRMNTPLLVGEVGYVGDNFPNLYIPDRLWLIQVKDKGCCFPLWFCYQLTTKIFRSKLSSIASGTSGSMKNISQANFFNLEISKPSLEEQKKIALFLSLIDQKISLLNKKHELLIAYKKGVMQKIFNQEIKFRDDVGNHYAGWQFLRLGDVSDVRDGTHDSPKYQSAGKPLVTSKNLLKNGTLDLDNTNYISEIDFININKRSKVDVGDILFGMIGTIGNPVMVKTCNFAIKNVALIKEIDLLKNSFLSYYLSSSSIQKQISIANAGNSQKFISLGSVRNLEVALPVIAEQLKIVSFLSALDEKIAIVKKQFDLTSQYRHGLLQQMFI